MVDMIVGIVVVSIASQIINLMVVLKFVDVIEGIHKREFRKRQ